MADIIKEWSKVLKDLSDNKDKMPSKKRITVSCGIGFSFEEASSAMQQAKNKKQVYYNIKIYKGPRLKSKFPERFKQKVKDYFRLSKQLPKKQKEILENLVLYDYLTGMYNKTGFLLKLEELKRRGVIQGYYMLFDLDDLHYWNKKLGYAGVDKYIENFGRELLDNIRHQPRENEMPDMIGHRLNESAGDEFLIFIPLKYSKKNSEIIINLAKRLIDKVYSFKK